MKKVTSVFFLLIGCIVFSLSCGKPCAKNKGTLELTNKSLNTIQKVMINGINYGTLDPGEKKSFDLNIGEYDVIQQGISGGTGCSAAKVNIVACETQGMSCSN